MTRLLEMLRARRDLRSRMRDLLLRTSKVRQRDRYRHETVAGIRSKWPLIPWK